MKKTILLFITLFIAIMSYSQVGINTDGSDPDESAILDVKSTTLGLLIPRMTEIEKNAINLPATGLLVFQTNEITGFYFNKGTPVSPDWEILSGDNLGDHIATENLDLSNYKIINLSEPTAAGDAATKQYVDNNGDNLGNHIAAENLDLSNYKIINLTEPTENTDAATKQYVDSNSGDNLGNHIATENVKLTGNWLSNDGGNEGVFVADDGKVGIGNATPSTKLDVDGTVTATSFSGDGSGLSGISGDNLGNHTATESLNLDNNKIINLTEPTANTDAATKQYVDANSGDNLGDHIATENVKLTGNWLSNDGENEGVFVAADGKVGVGNAVPSTKLDVDGIVTATSFLGDGSGLTGISGDNLGNHTATTDLNMSDHKITNLTIPTANGDAASKLYVDSNAGDDLGNHIATTDLNMSNNKITNLTIPTANGDAASKWYVDSNAGDDLGNHTATQNVELDGNWLSNDGGNEGVYVATDGKVGIGTPSPYAALEVEGDGSLLGGLRVTGKGAGTVASSIYLDAQNKDWTIHATGPSSATGDQKFVIRDYTSAEQRLVIDTDGDVGIGTNNPSTKLDVGGTVTADAFVGDGSGLTGVSGDNLGDHNATQYLDMNYYKISALAYPTSNADAATKQYVDAVSAAAGDDLGNHIATSILNMTNHKITNLSTPTANTDAATKLYVDNSGDNLGNHTATSILNMTNHKITNLTTPTANADAATKLYVDNNSGDNLGNHEASQNIDMNGYQINGTGRITVDPVTYSALYVIDAGQRGLDITKAGWQGIVVGEAALDGIAIGTTGSPSTTHSDSNDNGLEVEGAQGNGVYIGQADMDGMHIYKAGTVSTTTSSNHDNGVEIEGAAGYGLYVGNSGNDGVYLANSGGDGYYVYEAEDYGFKAANVGLDGFYVQYPGDDGFYVYSATDDGLYINNAGDDAIYSRTTNTSNEWGLYTPDKIYANNVTSKGSSSYAKNAGNSTLEPGDIVCIAGGLEENVLNGAGFPVVNISKATKSNSQAVFGVVEYKVTIREDMEDAPEGKIPELKKSFEHADGNVMQGDYLSVIVFGQAEVKVSDSKSIQAGNKLTVSETAGKARTLNSQDSWAETGILGKALENSAGNGKITVFVNCK